jgi:hypothetical protein
MSLQSCCLQLCYGVLQEDSSLTRSDAYFLDLIKRAGYTLLASALQRNFPKSLFKVAVFPSHCAASACIVAMAVQLLGEPTGTGFG